MRGRDGEVRDLIAFVLDDHAVAGIAGWSAPFGSTAPLTVVVLRPRRERSATEALRHRFGLTGAKIEVVRALGAGPNLQEIANSRGRSRLTVRNQIRSAMQKTDVRRKVDLVLMHSRRDPKFPSSFPNPCLRRD